MRFETDMNMGDMPAPISIPAQPKTNDLESINKSLLMDSHNRQIIKNLERESKSREILDQAEERLGMELER